MTHYSIIKQVSPNLVGRTQKRYRTTVPYDHGTNFQYISGTLTSVEAERQLQLSMFDTTSDTTDFFDVMCITILSNESLVNRLPDEG